MEDRLHWFDAATARQGQEAIWSEDFQHDRLYGSVRVLNPFTVD